MGAASAGGNVRVELQQQWKRPLIVGGTGQVGIALRKALTQHASNVEEAPHILLGSRNGEPGVTAIDLAALQSPEEVAGFLDPLRPEVVLCPAAMTYVDGCEQNPLLAYRTNALGPSVLASWARSRDVPFVFFSTDYVFAGGEDHAGPYGESDPTAPLSVYGASKLQGEQAVLRVHPEALILRTSWVYGPDPAGKNFIAALRRQLAAGQRVRVPRDQLSTPTLNSDLAAMTLALLDAGASGVVHVAGPELMSRYELALAAARFFGLDETLIEGVTTASLGQLAARPLLSGLRSARIGGWTLPVSMHVLEEGLKLTSTQRV